MKEIFKPKFFSIIKEPYSRNDFSKDLFSGIIVGIVALPLAIAFAVASGVSPEKGLITAVIAGFIISFLGGSRVQIGGPTGAFIVIVLAIVNQYGVEGLIISTMIAGVMLVLFGLLRLGNLLKFIPYPLIVGFTSGIAVVIFSTQIKDALGLQIAEIPADFISKWGVYFQAIGTVNIYAVIIMISTVLITVFFSKITNKIPGSFVAILLLTVLTALFNLPVNTIESVYGDIPGTIHIEMPNIDLAKFKYYLEPALTIALLGGIESLLSAVVADGMTGGKHRSNTELIAQGIANIITPIFGGIPATGAIARTATNIKNGGKTPIAGMVHAICLLLIMLFFGKWAKLIPMPCLAGILIVVSYNMSGWRSFHSIMKSSFFDILILLTTFLLTVLVDLTIAIQIGIVLSALLFMKRMADNSHVLPIEENDDEKNNYSDVPKEIEIYEISGPFFFAAAKQYSEILKNLARSKKVMIIRMRHVPFIDATGINNFKEAILSLNKDQKSIILSGVRTEVKKELDKSGISQIIGENNIFDTYESALRKAKNLI